MLRHCLVGSLLSIAALAGCQTNSANGPANARPVSVQELTGIRDAYHHDDPNIRVGLVTAVSADLASVGDVNTSDFQPADVITFLDSQKQTLALGTVDSIEHNMLIVKFQVQPGGRAPRQGDLGVRFVK